MMSTQSHHLLKHTADDPVLPDILKLVQRSFAYMDDRIDPPSSMHRLTVEDIASQCDYGEVWSIGEPPYACVFLKERDGRLYVGKLAVDETKRGLGLARVLMELTSERARERNLTELELEVRVELTENRAAFEKLGFIKCGESAHEGYNRPTSITMRKKIS